MKAERRPKGAASEQAYQPTTSIVDIPVGLRDAAIWYARHRWPVFPIARGDKVPAITGGRGFRDASDDLSTVERWWCRYPSANIGMPTGVSFDVLDFDVKPTGDAGPHLNSLRDAGVLAGCAGIASTRNGGVHLYFPASGDSSHSIRLLDFKAAGGYVLLPPSRVAASMPEGEGLYRWAVIPTFGAGRPLDWSLVKSIVAPPRGRCPAPASPRKTVTRLHGLIRAVATAREGERNNLLFWALCRALEAGADPAPLLEAAGTTGLSGEEISRTLGSAKRHVQGGAR